MSWLGVKGRLWNQTGSRLPPDGSDIAMYHVCRGQEINPLWLCMPDTPMSREGLDKPPVLLGRDPAFHRMICSAICRRDADTDGHADSNAHGEQKEKQQKKGRKIGTMGTLLSSSHKGAKVVSLVVL